MPYAQAAARTVAVRAQELFDARRRGARRQPTSSACTTCASPRGACARSSRSSRPASRAATTRPSCATSSAWPTRSASAATPTCSSRRSRRFEQAAGAGRRAGRRGVRRPPARGAGGRQRGAGRRAGRRGGGGPARTPRAARRGGRGTCAEAAGRHEGAHGQGPRPRRAAGRQPRAHRPHAARRAVRVRARPRWTPTRPRRCTTCGSPPSGCATSSRSPSRASGPYAEKAPQARQGAAGPARARSTTATSRGRGSLAPAPPSCRPPTRATSWRAPTARRTSIRRSWPPAATPPPGAASRRSPCSSRARRALLFERFRELWRDLERQGFRARLEYAITERPEDAPATP